MSKESKLAIRRRLKKKAHKDRRQWKPLTTLRQMHKRIAKRRTSRYPYPDMVKVGGQ